MPRPPRGTGLERHVTSGGENDDVIGENGANDAEDVGDRDPRPNRSPDLVLNGRQQDQKLTGSSSSACTSGRDDRRCASSSGRKHFSNQQTLDGN